MSKNIDAPFKVVCIDKYNRENVSDRLIHSGIELFEDAQIICDILNKQNPEGFEYFKVYGASQELYKFEP